jgi:CarboxypepD_reg-like domain
MNSQFRSIGRVAGAPLLAVVIGLWLSGCASKASNPVSSTNNGNTVVNGVVYDASTSGNPAISGATVQLVGTTTSLTTDANGMFSLPVTAGVNQTISITKTGYSTNDVVVNIASGTKRNITVNLMQAGTTQTVAVNSGGKVTDTKSNATLSLPANAVSATGNVSVTVTGLDPTTDDVRALPGGLEAVDANGNTKYLQPVSFAEYVVKDANGNVLQFNQSSSSGANIELPIPASLRGKAGYENGDPIECYVFDPTDGKWKTPVPGVVGPSSVDGTPAIKATIFHLSWYGGAPALNQRACITGYVKNTNGTPASGAFVEAYPGGSGTTDATGLYDIDAAPSSNVRVVASVLSGSLISSAEIVVYTGSSTDSCYTAPDLTLGAPQQGTFEVDATLFKVGTTTSSTFDYASATIRLKTPSGTISNYDGADVKIGYGTTFTSIPSSGSGSYVVYTGMQGASNFSLSPGQQYEITIDFDKNGTIDATGFVRMVGVVTNTYPPDSATVPNHFTATWNDNGSSVAGYSADYWLTIAGDSASRYFVTTTNSKVVGDGSVDSSFYGYYLSNAPLPAGQYTMSVWAFNGPAGFLTVGQPLPNINGQNVSGFFYSYYFGESTTFNSSGLSSRIAAAISSRNQHWPAPLAFRQFYNSIPSYVKEQAHLSLPSR